MNRDCLEHYPGNESRIWPRRHEEERPGQEILLRSSWPLLLLFILMQLKAAMLIVTACSHGDQRVTHREEPVYSAGSAGSAGSALNVVAHLSRTRSVPRQLLVNPNQFVLRIEIDLDPAA